MERRIAKRPHFSHHFARFGPLWVTNSFREVIQPCLRVYALWSKVLKEFAVTVLVVGNQKGGVGKTTVAILFAQWLAERQGQRVAVVDLDSQCNCSKSLARFNGGLESVKLFDGKSNFQIPSSEGGLVLLPGSRELADLELAAPGVVIPAFRAAVRRLATSFDTVLIDTPPALGLRMSAALIAADRVLCPIELEEYSVDGLTGMLRTVFGVRQRYNPTLELLGILANRFNPHSARQKLALRQLLQSYGQFVLPAYLSTRIAIPEAIAAGVPVWKVDKSSAREAVAELFKVFEVLWEKMGKQESRARPQSAEALS
jgi:chromosome partitioning protein